MLPLLVVKRELHERVAPMGCPVLPRFRCLGVQRRSRDCCIACRERGFVCERPAGRADVRVLSSLSSRVATVGPDPLSVDTGVGVQFGERELQKLALTSTKV